jgi:hypothetical protein
MGMSVQNLGGCVNMFFFYVPLFGVVYLA